MRERPKGRCERKKEKGRDDGGVGNIKDRCLSLLGCGYVFDGDEMMMMIVERRDEKAMRDVKRGRRGRRGIGRVLKLR